MLLASYITSCPFVKLWSVKKVIWLVFWSTPPPWLIKLPENDTSLDFLTITGSTTAPVPLPPVTLTVVIASRSKSRVSTSTRLISPPIANRTNAVVPTPAEIVDSGRLITS